MLLLNPSCNIRRILKRKQRNFILQKPNVLFSSAGAFATCLQCEEYSTQLRDWTSEPNSAAHSPVQQILIPVLYKEDPGVVFTDVLWHHVGLSFRILWWFSKTAEYKELEDLFCLLS